MAVADRDKTCSIRLNGKTELFIAVVDPINGSATRRLFTRASWTTPPLYWYIAYGAMTVSSGVTVVTPCVCGDNDDTVCVSILETRCNRPRYNCLFYNIATDSCCTGSGSSMWTKLKLNLNKSFDSSAVQR